MKFAGRLTILIVCFAFLYAPIGLLALYSFNASRLSVVWAGFSTRWYVSLLSNEQMQAAALISLQAAALSAALATLLGFLAALALTRLGAFAGRNIFVAGLFAPIVLPEIVLGLSLLLLFVGLGVGRGFWTLVIAHATFLLGFATLVLRARLVQLDPALEEAARDLGAHPLRAFVDVALPQMLGALASAYCLCFILSLDDVVIASFASGPGATTLPMRIYSQARLGVSPEINAVSTLFLAAAGLVLGLVGALQVFNARRNS